MVEAIRHLGVEYTVHHLAPHQASFEWTDANETHRLSVRVRYSPHCYSEGTERDTPAGSFFFSDAGGARVFSPSRHAHSLLVPGLIGKLIARPTSRVGLTYEKNWSLYALKMTPPLGPGELFYTFFRLRRAEPAELEDGVKRIELYVESAYSRLNRVPLRESRTFGSAALASHKK